MKRLLSNLLLVVLSLLFVVLLGEGLLRGLQWGGLLPVYSAKSLQRYQSPYPELNARLQRSDNPRLAIEFDRKDPNINSAGFRGSELPLARTPGTFRIAVLGDSVAYGYSVPLADSFPALLQQALSQQRPVEVLNFAVNGYGTVAQQELLRTRVWEYQPDLVLLAYVLNDPVPPDVMMKNVGAAMRFAATLDRVGRRSQLGAWLLLLWSDALRALQGDAYAAFYASDAYWPPVVTAVQVMKEEADAHGAVLVAAIFPLLRDFTAYPMAPLHQQVGGLFHRLGVPYVDLLADFRSHDHRQFMLTPVDDTHPNAAGHRLAAESLARFLAPQLPAAVPAP